MVGENFQYPCELAVSVGKICVTNVGNGIMHLNSVETGTGEGGGRGRQALWYLSASLVSLTRSYRGNAIK